MLRCRESSFKKKKSPRNQRAIMKKPRVLGIIVGVALIATTLFSLHWSHENLALSVDRADARVVRQLTTGSVVRKVHRKTDGGAHRDTMQVGGCAAGGHHYNRPLNYYGALSDVPRSPRAGLSPIFFWLAFHGRSAGFLVLIQSRTFEGPIRPRVRQELTEE